MKQLLILIAIVAITGNIMSQTSIEIPVDFESSTINYTFGDFEGGVLEVIDNPDMSGINTSAKVARMVKNPGAVFAGSSFLVGTPMDFANNNTIKMKVWSPKVGASVLFKVENSTNASINFEKSATTTVANAWEELSFDYSAINSFNSYDKIVLIFELGTAGDGSANFTYYLDDINLSIEEGPSNLPVIPVDFESSEITYSFGDFEGGVLDVINNPDMSGINTSAKVARMVKNAGAVFAGSAFLLGSPMDFANNNLVKMKVWSPKVGASVLFKVENSGNAAQNFEKSATTTVANGWEELSFDYSAINSGNVYDKIVLIFELGTGGDGSSNFTYYLDDINLTSEQVEDNRPFLPLDFEDAGQNYELEDFGGNASTIVTDPTDASNTVVQSIKTASAMTWAGTTAGEQGLKDPILFNETDTKISVRVWSPDAGIPVRLKTENVGDPTITVETEATTSVAGDWETLEFNFANQAEGTAALDITKTFNKISIFFNFGTSGEMAGEKTYYWDDVIFAGTSVVNILNAQEANINIGPVPASDFIHIELPANINEDVLMTIYDISGNLIQRSTLRDNLTRINVSRLISGTYMVKMSLKDEIVIQKVMVIK